MNIPQLDERLKAVAEFYTDCRIGADIGTDHGHLPCYLLSKGICEKMVLSDISADSLLKARHLMQMHCLEDRAVFRLADGLDAIKGISVDCVSISGMGGKLIAALLYKGHSYLNNSKLIISAHTDIPIVRKALMEIGYHFSSEKIVFSRGRYYIIMLCEPGQQTYSPKELYIGPKIILSESPLRSKYLSWRRDVVARENGHQLELSWIMEELENAYSNNTNDL